MRVAWHWHHEYSIYIRLFALNSLDSQAGLTKTEARPADLGICNQLSSNRTSTAIITGSSSNQCLSMDQANIPLFSCIFFTSFVCVSVCVCIRQRKFDVSHSKLSAIAWFIILRLPTFLVRISDVKWRIYCNLSAAIVVFHLDRCDWCFIFPSYRHYLNCYFALGYIVCTLPMLLPFGNSFSRFRCVYTRCCRNNTAPATTALQTSMHKMQNIFSRICVGECVRGAGKCAPAFHSLFRFKRFPCAALRSPNSGKINKIFKLFAPLSLPLPWRKYFDLHPHFRITFDDETTSGDDSNQCTINSSECNKGHVKGHKRRQGEPKMRMRQEKRALEMPCMCDWRET